MSSLVTSSTGLRRIEVFVDGKRHKIRLRRMPLSAVQKLKVRIDALCEARALGSREPDSEKWCLQLKVELRERLMDIGLLPQSKDETLGGLIDRFYKSRTHVKPSTVAADKQATDALIEWFGETKLLKAITPIDAQEWAEDLAKGASEVDPDRKKLAEATLAKRIIKAKSVFAKAVKPWKLLESNPLDGLRIGSQKNDSRQRFIDVAMSQAVLDACPDAEWRAIFSLARWGGLRIPSEIENMRWSDIIWDKNRFRIICQKTANHDGREERWCPLFTEVHQALIELQELASAGTDFIFSVKRRQASNLRNPMMKIVRRAGLTVWPRLFQNLRSTRETELCERYPEHLVCEWLGNSPKTARKHYLQMLDFYFDMAAQKAAQQACADPRITNLQIAEFLEKTNIAAAEDLSSGRYRANSLRDSLRKLLHSHGCGAKSGALANAIVEFLKQPAGVSP